MKVFEITNPKMIRSKITYKLGDPKGMGYVTDKGIFFASEEERKAFSKAACLRGPQCDPPYEIVTVARGNSILFIGKGDFYSVDIPEKYYSMPDVEIEHSHPHCTPLSVSDYNHFLQNKYKSITAYTPDGRYSKISSREPEKNYRFFQKFFRRRDMNRKLEIARKNIGYAQGNFFGKTSWMYKVLANDYDEEMIKKLERKTEQYGLRMNVVWEIFAKKLGVKYENNFREKPKVSIFKKTLDVVLKDMKKCI